LRKSRSDCWRQVSLRWLPAGQPGHSLPRGGPPAVGVAEAKRRPITETGEFLGRIEAINRGFVTVVLEGVQPVEGLAIPRAAVLSDQQADYVLAVGTDNEARQRRIQRGQSSC
jgi:multidrug efflux pump subunit AcrA (membrane-fusion protein)